MAGQAGVLSDGQAGWRWAWERWAGLSFEASPLAGTNPADPLPNIRIHVPRRAHYVARHCGDGRRGGRRGENGARRVSSSVKTIPDSACVPTNTHMSLSKVHCD